MQIVGDVSYIVRDSIIVQNGVSVAPNSHVVLQAGQVIELTNVEFDGTNSSVEILQIPCPNRVSCDGESGGVATLNAGMIEVPESSKESLLHEFSPKGQAEPGREAKSQYPTIEALTKLSAYPNPFAEQVTISFFLETESQVDLRILDLQMRPVRTVLSNSTQKSGQHELTVDLKDLPASIYLVQAVVNGMQTHQRIVKQ